MNRTRTWILALLAGFLAGGDWFLATLPADGHPGLQPGLRIDEGLVTAYLTGEGQERHVILNVPRGSAPKPKKVKVIKVRLHEIPDNSNTRYVALGLRAVMEAGIPLDAGEARSINLGAAPTGKNIYTLTASVDDKNLVPLLWWLSK